MRLSPPRLSKSDCDTPPELPHADSDGEEMTRTEPERELAGQRPYHGLSPPAQQRHTMSGLDPLARDAACPGLSWLGQPGPPLCPHRPPRRSRRGLPSLGDLAGRASAGRLGQLRRLHGRPRSARPVLLCPRAELVARRLRALRPHQTLESFLRGCAIGLLGRAAAESGR